LRWASSGWWELKEGLGQEWAGYFLELNFLPV
jgi:hypothetical protein